MQVPRSRQPRRRIVSEQRSKVQEELAAQTGEKVGVAAVAKAIGERWQQLSDEEKDQYKKLAAEKAEALRDVSYILDTLLSTDIKSAAEDGDDGNGDALTGEQLNADTSHNNSLPQPFGLPLSLVKKIACMDSEVQRLSTDAARCISKATAIFVEFLAVKSLERSSSLKRKNFKFSDIQAAASHDRRLRDMGLPQFLREDEVFQEIHSGTGKAGKEGNDEMSEAVQKDKHKPLNSRAMTDFYRVA